MSLFNICIVEKSRDSSKAIMQQVDNFFGDCEVEYEVDIITYGSLISPEIWADCGYNLAIIDISTAEYRDRLMEYSMEIRKACHDTKVIFISDDLHGSLDIFEYDPNYFIYKPQIADRLSKALDRLFTFEMKSRVKSLVLSTKSAKHIIPKRSIIYLERYQHDTRIVCDSKTVVCHDKLTTLLDKIDDRMFLRCHCSFVVNLKYVREFTRTQLLMSNGDVVPCSRANQKIVSAALTTVNDASELR